MTVPCALRTVSASSIFITEAIWCRRIFEDALEKIYRREIGISGLPVYGRYTLYRRGNERWLHLLGLLPIQRSGCSVLEEPTPRYNLEISIPDFCAESITLMPQAAPLSFSAKNGVTRFTLPVLRGHQLIVLKKA